MGALANSLFQLMLGWIRSLSVELWNTVFIQDNQTVLKWVGQHWIFLAVLLCTFGLITDLVIYLFRWQPYRVWASFFRRIRHPEETDEVSDASGTGQNSKRSSFRGPKPAYETPGPSARYVQEESTEITSRAEPEEPLTWHRTEPEGTTAAFEQAILPTRKRRMRQLLSEKNEETYASPDQLIDRYAAYRRPVYPRSWKEAESDDEGST